MAKAPEVRIFEQMAKLGIPSNFFGAIKAQHEDKKFDATEKGSGPRVRAYLESQKAAHPEWFAKNTTKAADDAERLKLFDTKAPDFNVTRAMQEYKKNPEKAAAAARANGWKL